MNLREFERIICGEVALPELSAAARRETLKHFGRTIQLYAPLYLSNECVNSCVYCGFNRRSMIKRVTLTLEEALVEADCVRREGFQHLLVLTGEYPSKAPVSYLRQIIAELKKKFTSITIEVYPMMTEDYRSLIEAGVDGLTIYQETYHRPTYQAVHPDGPKRDYDWRYGAPARAAEAGMRKIGLGFLLGLYDWREEALKLAAHVSSLLKDYWQTQLQISFPRINPAETNYKVEYPVSDDDFLRLVCALRLLFPEIGFTLSTREKAAFRDRIFQFGLTQMSAGSKTAPGGYALDDQSGKQFDISDERTPQEVALALRTAGYEPVWKDWERILG
ncbi:MAG: 2-iminoacetate synthase ThiH [Candidatus Margulisiibacteriota bacterium]|jgi:2-iminoacetate synthase